MTRVEQVKAAFPLARFVARYTNGLKPTRPGWYIGRCPFHQPPTDPANKRKFWVNDDLGICGCFVPRCPAHGKPMDVINFWARLQGMTNPEALNDLWDRLPPGNVIQSDRVNPRRR